MLAVAVAVWLGACGGSSHSTTSTTSTTTAPPSSQKSGALTETVEISKSGITPGASVTGHTGDTVEFRTRAPGTSTAGPVKVKLLISHSSPATWTVTAISKHERATASVNGAAGKTLQIVELRYTCLLPPAPSFCPARQVLQTGKQLTLAFRTTPATPITVAGIVGPIPAPSTPTPRTGTLVVPAYTVTELVEARSLSAPSSITVVPTATAAAKAGEEVVIRTRIKGTPGGAPQPLTVSFDQGPGKTLNVSASVPGGSPSRATITSAGGSPITLVSPRFACYLPPMPSFCPASKVSAAGHHYSITFQASPATPVAIVALVQAG